MEKVLRKCSVSFPAFPASDKAGLLSQSLQEARTHLLCGCAWGSSFAELHRGQTPLQVFACLHVRSLKLPLIWEGSHAAG